MYKKMLREKIKLVHLSIFLIICGVVNSGCATRQESSTRRQSSYNVKDLHGEYLALRKIDLLKDRFLRVHKKMKSGSDLVEEVQSISEIGALKTNKGAVKVARPYTSKYSTWIEGKEESTQIKLDKESRSLLYQVKGEKRQSRKLEYSKGLFCFYSQLTECLRTSGTLRKLKQRKGRKASFNLIFEGFPHVQKLYPSLPNDIISSATISYSQELSQGHRYEIEIGDDVLFLVLDKNFHYTRLSFIKEGLTEVRVE